MIFIRPYKIFWVVDPMNKERLDELKKKTTGKDYLWAIKYAEEQAERVLALEGEAKRLRKHIFEARNDVVNQSNLLEESEQQNKRYREHLEYMLAEAKDHKEKGLKIQHWALIEDLEKVLAGE